MKIGLQVPNFTWPGGPAQIPGKLAEIARVAESAGFYSLWVMDHFFQISMVGPPEAEMPECYTALGFLAAHTTRVKLGAMVTGVVYRYPGILVKSVTTLDVLSGGRAYFGIGAAWNEQEAKGLGVPFPPIAVRFELLEEALQITKQMWSADNGVYRGKHNYLEQTLCSPQPLSRQSQRCDSGHGHGLPDRRCSLHWCSPRMSQQHRPSVSMDAIMTDAIQAFTACAGPVGSCFRRHRSPGPAIVGTTQRPHPGKSS
jgi:hypothetical protein